MKQSYDFRSHVVKPRWTQVLSALQQEYAHLSDTLPMDSTYFDVVIFDEASQITLEEAVPSVFRACQAIVVGDEMQLPPTDFFSARQTTEEEQELLIEEGGEVIQYDLASNSFLNLAAKNLPSTMLGWHYRSRSESLIIVYRLPEQINSTLRVRNATEQRRGTALRCIEYGASCLFRLWSSPRQSGRVA